MTRKIRFISFCLTLICCFIIGNASLVSAVVKEKKKSYTIYVPKDFPTIQEAIDAAIDNDTIIVAAGTYEETLEILNKDLSIKGAGAEGDTISIISGYTGPASGVSVISITGSDVAIEGFLIQNGINGLFVHGGSSVAVVNTRLENNEIGSLVAYTSNLYIDNSTVSGNQIHGIRIWNNSGALIQNCTISENSRSGVVVQNSSGLDMLENKISQNGEQGIFATSGSSIYLRGGNVISNNLNGIIITLNSSLMVGRVSFDLAKDIISQNTQGILVNGTSSALIMDATITDTESFGVFVFKNSNAEFWAGAQITNNRFGIGLDKTSSYTIPKAPDPLVDFTGNILAVCFDCSDLSQNDFDGDGYRPIEYVFDLISGTIVERGDCDDYDPNIYPGNGCQ